MKQISGQGRRHGGVWGWNTPQPSSKKKNEKGKKRKKKEEKEGKRERKEKGNERKGKKKERVKTKSGLTWVRRPWP